MYETEFEEYKLLINEAYAARMNAIARITFGKTLAEECTIRLSAIPSPTEEVLSFLNVLGPVKLLLEAGTLDTALGALNDAATIYTGDSLAMNNPGTSIVWRESVC